jgi:hypothetical protein
VSAVPDPSGHDDDVDADGYDARQLADGLLFVIPDDARDLEADRQAYLRELAESHAHEIAPEIALESSAASRPFLPRLARTRRFESHGLSGPLVTAVLLVVALIGSLMTVLAPRNAPAPAARPLARTTQPAGQPGGLLPDTTLSVGPVEVLARSIRPSVLLFVPTNCPDCAKTVSAVLLQVRSHRLQLLLVGPKAQHDQLADLDRRGASGQATLAIDETGALGKAYAGSTPTVVVVAADGVVTAIEPGVTPSLELDPDLFNALRAV